MLPGRFSLGTAYVGSGRGRVYAYGASEAGSASDASSAVGSFASAAFDRPSGIGASVLGAAPVGRYAVGGPAVGATDRFVLASAYTASVSEAGSASDSNAAGSYVSGNATDALSAADVLAAGLAAVASLAESGNATDALAAIGSLLAFVQEYGAAADYPDSTALKPVAAIDYPSGLGSGSIGAGPVGAVPLGGGRYGVSDTARASGSVGGIQTVADALSAYDVATVGLLAVASRSDVPTRDPAAIGLSVVGGQVLGGGARIGPVSVYVPGPGARDASSGGIPKFGALVDAPTNVALPALSARPIVGGYAIGAAPIGGTGVPITIYSLGARDVASQSYLYTRELDDVLLALDAAFAFSIVPGSLADALFALDRVSITTLAAIFEIGYASDAYDAVDFALLAVRIATAASGLVVRTSQSGAIVLSRGSGEVVTTVGSGVSITTKGSGTALTTTGSGVCFLGSEIMAATINQNFFLGEHWPILGTATDFQGRILDLTNSTIRMRLVDSSGQDVMDLSVGLGITILSPSTAGQYLIQVSPGNQISSKIAPGPYAIEVRITTGAGIVTTQLVGTINVVGSEFS